LAAPRRFSDRRFIGHLLRAAGNGPIGKILGACWIAIGVVYYLVLTFVLKKSVVLEV
jgi:hypothetical protein